MNRSPAYQYYPDKYECHTRHLSDYAYRIYHRLLNWMWLHSKDYCSISAEASAVAVVLGEPCERIADAMQEIMNPHMPLLKEVRGKWVNGGLKKEAEKQRLRRVKAQESAKARWNKGKSASDGNANALRSVCSPSPTPTPSPTVVKKRERVVFKVPQPEEVTAYAKTIDYTLDGSEFCDFYASKGWMVGKNKMKDWKACVRTWKKKNKKEDGGGRWHSV